MIAGTFMRRSEAQAKIAVAKFLTILSTENTSNYDEWSSYLTMKKLVKILDDFTTNEVHALETAAKAATTSIATGGRNSE